MKILYISPENTVGLLNMWKQIHSSCGNEATFITMYPSKQKFDDGICLNLPFINTGDLYIKARNMYYKIVRGPMGDQETRNNQSIYNTTNWIEKIYFNARDILWKSKIERAIKNYNLLDYDIYHFEWGADLYRNFSFVRRLKEMGKPIIAHYHGQDFRIRGVFKQMDEFANLNITSEIDLIDDYKKLNYLPLPFIFPKNEPDYRIEKKIRLCHATTNRYYKGSEIIIKECQRLVNQNDDVEFVLIENKSHENAMKIKKMCDINIDQIGNRGGWGYGMNSVEAMSMGLCVASEINSSVEQIIGQHPFININQNNLYDTMSKLIKDKQKIYTLKKSAYSWGLKNHDIGSVGQKLYNLYKGML